MPQFVPVSIMDPSMLAGQAQWPTNAGQFAVLASDMVRPAPNLIGQQPLNPLNQVFGATPQNFGMPQFLPVHSTFANGAPMTATAYTDESAWATGHSVPQTRNNLTATTATTNGNPSTSTK